MAKQRRFKLSAQNLDMEYQRVQRLHQQGKPDKAHAIYKQVLMLEPKNPYLLDMFGFLANRYSMYDVAIELLRSAVDSDVVESDIYGHLAVALRNAGQLQEAQTWYERSLQLNLHNAGVLHNYADLLLELGELDKAVLFYRQALNVDPAWLDTYNNLAEALMRLDELEEALELLNYCLIQQPGRVRALRLKCIVLSELGYTDELDQLVNFDQLLFCRHIKPVKPFTNITETCRQLANFVSRHPGLSSEIQDISTQHGSQTRGNLFAEKHLLIDALRQMVQQVVDDYAEHLTQLPGHPHAQVIPNHWRLEGWGVRLKNQGFQSSHVHYDGWSSCVYYLSLPDVISQSEHKNEGWIEFGCGPGEFYKHSIPPVRRVKPEEGLFVMFPSWFWHKTIPFESEQPRISIAFDIIPAAEGAGR